MLKSSAWLALQSSNDWHHSIHLPSITSSQSKASQDAAFLFSSITVKPTNHTNCISFFTVLYLIQTDPTPHCDALITYFLIRHHTTLIPSLRSNTTLRCTYHILSDTQPPNVELSLRSNTTLLCTYHILSDTPPHHVDSLPPLQHHTAMHLSHTF